MKTTNHVQNLIAILHGKAKVGKAICTILEPGEVGDDGRRPLFDASELGGEDDQLVLPVFQEEGTD